ncbi:MmcQ/YjbR family DNA-binding protein [Nocardioides sp.]|uniref:MmcQ/YjbR family DNA-binding protein n=1 Tax=Nocardioides sp. TaxID=35761 RepID=UPI002ED841B5
MPHPPTYDEGPALERLREIALALPDAAEKESHGSLAFYTGKVFAYYGGSEKVADGHARHRSSVLVLADPVELPALVESPRCYVPMYLGVSGWIGLHLEGDPDWDEVAELVETSYRLTAGPRRVQRLDARRIDGP